MQDKGQGKRGSSICMPIIGRMESEKLEDWCCYKKVPHTVESVSGIYMYGMNPKDTLIPIQLAV